jgi:hypothetical protein
MQNLVLASLRYTQLAEIETCVFGYTVNDAMFFIDICGYGSSRLCLNEPFSQMFVINLDNAAT